MANSLFQQLNPQTSNGLNINAVQSVKSMMNTVRGMANPMQAISNMAAQNPQLAGVMSMINGKNPKEVFYEQCKQRGVNPDDVINALK